MPFPHFLFVFILVEGREPCETLQFGTSHSAQQSAPNSTFYGLLVTNYSGWGVRGTCPGWQLICLSPDCFFEYMGLLFPEKNTHYIVHTVMEHLSSVVHLLTGLCDFMLCLLHRAQNGVTKTKKKKGSQTQSLKDWTYLLRPSTVRSPLTCSSQILLCLADHPSCRGIYRF